MWNSGLFGFFLLLFLCELSWAKSYTGLFKQVENPRLLWWSKDLMNSDVSAEEVLRAWAVRRVESGTKAT
ncbi:MAG: hypothetical protein ACO3LE_03600, partial [Bdellovibrionota bacterium]